MGRVCPSWLSFVLHNPIRVRFTDRYKILDESMVTKGSVVLEVGAGNGFLTEVIAERAKKVICIELQEGMVRKLRKRVASFGEKVEILREDIASYPVESAFADVAILYYSFHEVSRKDDAVFSIMRAIKDNGILAIYEPTVEVGAKDMLATITMFENSGFLKEYESKSLFTRFVRLRKKAGKCNEQ